MGFCTFCGKEIPEGGVCSCQQDMNQGTYAPTEGSYSTGDTYTTQGTYGAENAYAAAPQYNNSASGKSEGIVSSVVDTFKDTVKDPIGASKDFYANASVKKATVMVSLMAIVYVVTSFLTLIANRVHAYWTMRKEIGGWSLLSAEYKKQYKKLLYESCGLDGGAFAQAIFFPIIYMALMAAAMIGIAYLVNALFIKGKVKLTNLLKLAGSVSAPLITILVLRYINNCIHVSALNYIIFHISMVLLSLLVMLQVFGIMKDYIADTKKFLIILATAIAIMLIGHYLVDGLMLGKWYSYFESFPMLMSF